jgi:PPP family 3-phenylpropionic acid transporter
LHEINMPIAVSVRMRSFYAAFFLLLGMEFPFFWSVWLPSRSLSDAEIGLISLATQFVNAAATMAGLVADRHGRRWLMPGLAAVGTVAIVLLLPASGFTVLLLLSAAASLCFASVLALANASIPPSLTYGTLRYWGSISFILATTLTGILLDRRHDPDTVLYLMIGSALLILAAANGIGSPAPTAPGPSLAERGAVLTPVFVAFLISAMLIHASHQFYFRFSEMHWHQIGLSDTTVSTLIAEGVAAEIIFYSCSQPILRRMGPLGLLVLAGGAAFLRWSVTPFISALPFLAIVQLLHAFTFAAADVAAIEFIRTTVPQRRAATGQALYTAIVSVGGGFSALLGGWISGFAGATAYLAMAGLAGIGAFGATLLKRHVDRTGA